MSILLLLPQNFPKPHRIPIRGASPEDIAHTAKQCRLIIDLARSALHDQLGNLSENLSVPDAGYLDAKGIDAGMQDLGSEIDGRLQNLEDGRG